MSSLSVVIVPPDSQSDAVVAANSFPEWAIIVVVVACVALVAALFLAMVCYLRKRKRRRENDQTLAPERTSMGQYFDVPSERESSAYSTIPSSPPPMTESDTRYSPIPLKPREASGQEYDTGNVVPSR
jgi:hypothetical protein